MNTLPATEIDNIGDASAAHIVLAPSVEDGLTGALWVHRDYVPALLPYEHEGHTGPVAVTERFGDAESFCQYLIRFAEAEQTLATWNSKGLRAVLDYPARRQWVAEYPFAFAWQWQSWLALANNQLIDQKRAIEKLEELASTIVEPDPAALMNILRVLRGGLHATSEVRLREDGTADVTFSRNTTVSASGASLPPTFTILTPIIRGDTPYKLEVRLRADVSADGHLGLRFAIPLQDQAFEDSVVGAGGIVTRLKEAMKAVAMVLRAAD